MPRVSVVLPVRNGESTIESTIKSVLTQTYDDFNLIIVDDGSTDRTKDIVRKISAVDPRILYVEGQARGRTFARNLGISKTDSEYIAAMDADDLCMPERLTLQVAAMDADNSLAVIGTHISWFGEKKGIPRMLTSKRECRIALKLFSPLCHPSTLMRRTAFERAGRYINERQLAEDYDLFCRLSFFGEIANIPIPLLAYNIHKAQSSQEQKTQQTHDMIQTIELHHKRLLNVSALSKTRLSLRLIATACELGPSHARQSLRALRICCKSLIDQ